MIIENDWRAFGGIDYLVDHWDRPGWQDNIPVLYWLLPLGEHAELAQLATTCQRTLRGVAGLDMVPAVRLETNKRIIR